MLFEKADEIRVRFAPSPTGFLHIGGARTAIFNWLYAKRQQGKFLLRIEDTDVKRSDPQMVKVIYDGLKWLGLEWDGEPVFQSERLERYRSIVNNLVSKDKAYYCYCSQERLAQLRDSDKKQRSAYFYDGRCRNLSEGEKQNQEKKGLPRVVRFKVDPGEVRFNDKVRGSLTFNCEEIDDFVIMRSDDIPTYHLAVVVDDHDMNISHVIRGDDHLTNTPKQILLYKSLDWRIPNFAHVPLILGQDKKRLSKRHGAVSVMEYEANGYLADAMLNYLALLGWSPGNNREILLKEEMIKNFSLKKINKNSAIFDEDKLVWLNSQYIKQLSNAQLYEKLLPLLEQEPELRIKKYERRYIETAIGLLKSRLKRITDFIEYGSYFFVDPEKYDEKAVKKHWQDENACHRIRASAEKLSELDRFNEEQIETTIRNLAEQMKIGAGDIIHPVRLAITGYGVSPGIFELMAVLGKETVTRRLEHAMEYLNCQQ